MPEVWAGKLGELRAASTASGGTALTTTATFIPLPLTTSHLMITPRNFATAVVARIAINPWLVVLKTTDAMATTPTDYSVFAQDGSTDTAIDLSSMDTVTNGDFVLVGSHMPFRGAYATIGSTNSAGTATLSVDYWSGSWTSASATDGTNSTRTLAQSGLVSWTVPTNWQTVKLSDLYPLPPKNYYSDVPLFWTRWYVSALLADSSVTVTGLLAASRSTAYGEFLSGQSLEDSIHNGFGGIGCVEALTDAGTANLIVNVTASRDGGFN